MTIQLLKALLPSVFPKAMHLAFALSKFKFPVLAGGVAGAAVGAGAVDFFEPPNSNASVNKGPACA